MSLEELLQRYCSSARSRAGQGMARGPAQDPAFTARFPPFPTGQWGVSSQAHGQMLAEEHAAEPPLRQRALGGSCAQRSNKALIAISRHSPFFYVQFILEASIMSEAK